MKNLNIFRNNPPPAPRPTARPTVSAPIPGTGTHFTGNNIPATPRPAAAPAPQPAQGSTLAQPVGGGRHGAERVDINTVGWPASNRFTDKYQALRQKHTEARRNLENARATGSREEVKAAKKAEQLARREVDVWKQRNGGAMRTEADYRENYASRRGVDDSNTLPPMPDRPRDTGPRPQTSAPSAPPRTPSPAETYTSVGTDEFRMRDSSLAAQSPEQRRLEELKTSYRDSKNLYDGMRPERDIHTPQNVHAAKSDFKAAKRQLKQEMKNAQAEERLRRTGFQGPSREELRALLRPGQGNDAFPALGAAGHNPRQSNLPETLLP